MIEGWRYYNHAAIPTCAPHEEPNVLSINDGSIWKGLERKPLFVRWTSNWDCTEETNWWYVIKDTPLKIDSLKAKRRYEINKGIRNFETRIINPIDYKKDLYRVTLSAYSAWPAKYRPNIKKESFFRQIDSWNDYVIIGGFERGNDTMCGYALLVDCGSYVEFRSLMTDPSREKLAVNAAMVNGILERYNDRFDGKFYICDGEKSIRHETLFQDYLEKYFEFRKAYCTLHIIYRYPLKVAINILWPFRKLIKGRSKIGSLIAAVMRMESVCRSNKPI